MDSGSLFWGRGAGFGNFGAGGGSVGFFGSKANAQRVVAIEVLTAARGLWWRLRDDPSATLGRGSRAALAAVEELLGGRGRPAPSRDIELLAEAIRGGALLASVEREIGPLGGIGDG